MRHVLRGATASRPFAIATYRDTELGRTAPVAEMLAELRSLPGVDRLSLTGLDEDDLAVLLDQPSNSRLTSAVYAETEGNPFFTREVFRHLQETDAITKRADHWVADGPMTMLGIPEGVRGDWAPPRAALAARERSAGDSSSTSLTSTAGNADVIQAGET